MLDFEPQRCTRRCAKTNREFQPGESFVSVLLQEGNVIQRLDYSLEAWEQPPTQALAWWKSQMPGGGARHATWAPHEIMLDYLEGLENDESKADMRYLLALFMVRRRILRLEHVESGGNGEETMILDCPRKEKQYRVRVVMPTGARVAEIQRELAQLLYTPGA
jgi:hypothetical protein